MSDRISARRNLFLRALFAVFLQAVPCISATYAQAPHWVTLDIPQAWRSVPQGELSPQNGYSWYRALVHIPESWRGDALTLYVEALDDARMVMFAGSPVGAVGTFPPQFRSGLGERGVFTVAAEKTAERRFCVLAVRVFQSDPRPNFSVAPVVVMNPARGEAIRLEGKWQYRPGDDPAWGDGSPQDFGVPESWTAEDEVPAGVFVKTDVVGDVQEYVARRSGDTPALSPAAALARFRTAVDLRVELVLSDPEIAQPLFMTWDERGRLWVMEYRQYPDPAGLKMLSRDTFLRTVYDRVPAAPPNHVPGADRISIHEDTNGDGTLDAHRIFVDGLSIATSFAPGRGGVYVTNPPYLLFYPDADGDDVPDGDPEVLLEGFGLEDSHSVINSLRFGPDGWLYGAQGSTVTASVRAPGSDQPPQNSMGQLIWRFHPERKVYEVFAEGGGNTFGCEIDSIGRVFSGHNGGNTRGFHYVQGGYYRKGFGKHGPLSNPFAFGFFEQMKHHDVARFTHNFVIYEEQLLPERFHGQLLGVEPLQGQVVLSGVQLNQTSVETADIERVLTTDDPWFRPVDIKCGPDGAVYIADLYEQRIDHSSHYAGRVDRGSGRIYRLVPAASPPGLSSSVAASAADRPTDWLEHKSHWYRQTAVKVLGDHPGDHEQSLWSDLQQDSGARALDKLWALHAVNGLTESRALDLLEHPQPQVRAWTVRLLCDPAAPLSAPLATALEQLAVAESYAEVRLQLAASARRLPPEQAVPLISGLLQHEEDAGDIFIPMMLWWAIEAQVMEADPEAMISALLPNPQVWKSELIAGQLLEFMMRRYSISQEPRHLSAAARLLREAPDAESREILLRGFEQAYAGRSLAGLPTDLSEALAAGGGGSLALRFRRGDADAITTGVERMLDESGNVIERVALIEICGQLRRPEMLKVLQRLITTDQNEQVIAAALIAVQSYTEAELAAIVLDSWARFSGTALMAAESMLVSRKQWAATLIDRVRAGEISAAEISLAAISRIRMHGGSIEQQAAAIWGASAGLSADQAAAETDRIAAFLAAGSGNPRTGKRLFTQHCGRCHRLFDEGGQVGPDLTPFARQNQERMLSSIINPALEIREGYETFVLITGDGRILNGFLVQSDDQVVILRGVDGQNQIVRREDVDELNAIPQSVMPAGLLQNLDAQQVRDLFAYLRSAQPVNY